MSSDTTETRNWLAHQKASPDQIRMASQAIDDYEAVFASPGDSALELARLNNAALHPRKVVWEVSVTFLAALAAKHPAAREYLNAMSMSSKVRIRERSIYILGGLPRDFCLDIVGRLLSDRSAKLRCYAATRVECLDLTELQPELRGIADREKDSKTREAIRLLADLMEHGFIENKTPPYSILVRVIPGYHVSTTTHGNQRLTPALVEQIGIKTIRDKLAGSPAARAALKLFGRAYPVNRIINSPVN